LNISTKRKKAALEREPATAVEEAVASGIPRLKLYVPYVFSVDEYDFYALSSPDGG
jgi:hypothetical protein